MERNKYKEYNESKEMKFNELDNSNFLRGNTFDIKGYLQTVLKRGKSAYENSMIGSMQGMMQGVNPLKILASNPLKFVSDAAFNKMISKELRNSMGELDKTLSGFFKSALLKGSTFLRDKADTTGSKVFESLADILGLKRQNVTTMQTDKYVKDAVPWNGYSERALTEVIPTYLRKLLAISSGQEEMIYDYNSGKFNKLTDVKKSYKNEIDSSYMDIENVKQEISEMIKSAYTMSNSLQETFDKDLKDFFKTIVDNQLFYNPNKVNNEYLKDKGLYLRTGKEGFDLINNAMSALGKSKLNRFNSDVISAGEFRKDQMDRLTKQGQRLGYTGIKNGFDNSESGLVGARVDKYKKSAFDYLRDIRRILLEGIRVFPVNISDKNNIRIDGGSIEARINKYEDKETDHNPSLVPNSNYNVSKEELNKRAKNTNGEVLDNLYDLNISNKGMKDYIKRKYEESIGKRKTLTEQFNDTNKSILDKPKSVLSNIYDSGKEIASAPGKFIKNIIDSVNDNLLFFLYGSRDKSKKSIFDTLLEKINITLEKTQKTIDEHIIKPLSNILFNEENGIITKMQNKFSKFRDKVSDKLFNEKDGIFTNVKNSFNEIIYGSKDKKGLKTYIKDGASDIANGFMNVVSGREYTSKLTGEVHKAREENMMSIFKDMFSSVKDNTEKAFGKISNTKTGKSILETINDKINTITGKASHILFGTENEKISPKELFQTQISPRLPKTLLGALGGTALALVSPLGIVGGLAAGGSIGFLSNFDKFKTLLFGEEGSNRRIKVDNVFRSINERLPRMGVGSLTGAALSLFTPLGIVGGTLLGGTAGYLSASDKFKEMMFGNGKDKKGLIDRAYYEKFKSYLPAGELGAGLGVLGSFFLPGGPVGGAIVGLSLGIASQSNTIKTYLFGDEDPETGKRDGGLFGKFRIFMQTEIMQPLKTFAKEVGAKGLYFIRKELLNPILDSFAPIKKEMSLIKDKIFDSITNIKDPIIKKANDTILQPISISLHKTFIDPMKNMFKSIFSGILGAMKSIIKTPSSLVNSFAMNLMDKHKRMGVADYLDDWSKKKNARDYKTNKDYQESMQNVMFEKSRNKMMKDLVKKGKYDPNNKNTQQAMAWMNINGYKHTENMASDVKKSSTFLERLSNLFGEFKYRWDTRNSFKTNKSDLGKGTTTSEAGKQTTDKNKDFKEYIPKMDDIGGFEDKKNKSREERIKANKERNANKNKFDNGTIYAYGTVTNKNNNSKYNNKNVYTPNYNSSIEDDKSYSKSKRRTKNSIDYLENIKKNSDKILNSIDGQVNGVGYHTELIANILIDKFGLPSKMPKGGKMFSHKIKSIFDVFGNIFKKPKELFSKVVDTIAAPFKKVGSIITGIPKQIFKATKGVVSVTMNAIGKVAGGVFKLLPQILESINIIGRTVGNVIVSAFKTLPSIVKTLGVAFQEATKVVSTTLVQGIKVFGTGLKEATKFVGNLAVGFAKVTKEVLPAFASGLINTVKVVGKGVLGAVKGVFSLGKNMLGGLFGLKKKTGRKNMTNVISIQDIMHIATIDNVKMVEKIGDERLFQTLGTITSAIYSLKTGTDDEPIKSHGGIDTNIDNNSDHEARNKKKDERVRGTVIDITDRLKKKQDKEKREKNNRIVSGQDSQPQAMNIANNVFKDEESNTGNKQVDAFKNKEIGEINTKNAKNRNALGLAADKANISVGKIMNRVFKPNGILSMIATLALTFLPKAISFVKNIKSNAMKLLKKGIDYLLKKFKLPGLGGNTPNIGGKVGNTILKDGVEHAGAKGLESGAEHLVAKGAEKGLAHTAMDLGAKGASKFALGSAENAAEKATGKYLLGAGTEAVENAAEKYGSKNIIKGASYVVEDEAGKVIGKSGFKESVSKFGQKVAGSVVGDAGIINKIMNCGPVKKLAGSKIGTVLPKLGEFLTSKLKNAGKSLFTKLAAKWGTIIGTGAISGGLIPAIWYGGNILYGVTETNKLLGLAPSTKPTATMRLIAGFSAFVSDLVTFGLIPPSVIAQLLAGWVLTDEDAKTVQMSQDQLNNEYQQYVQDTGDDSMTLDDYNEKVNAGIFTKAGNGIKKGFNWTVNKIGEIGSNTWDGIKWAGGKIADGAQSAWNGAKWLGGKAVEGAKWLGNQAWNGVKSAGNFLVNDTGLSAFNNNKIRDTFGMSEDQNIQIKDRVAQGIGSTFSTLTGGLIDDKSIAKATRGAMLKVEDTWNYLGSVYDEKKKQMNEGLVGLDNKLGAMFGKTDEDGNPISLSQSIKNDFSDFGKSVAEKAHGAWEGAKSLWNSTKDKFDSFVETKNEAMESMDENLGSLFGFQDDDGNPLSFSAGAGYKLEKFGKGLAKRAKGLWKGLKSSIGDFIEWSKSGLQKMNDDIGTLMNATDSDGNHQSLTEYVSSGGLKRDITAKFDEWTKGLQDRSDAEGGSGEDGAVTYSQNSGPWANMNFGYNKSLAQAGCGPAVAASMISSVTGKKVTPDQTAKDVMNGGYRLKGNGTSWNYLNSGLNKYGVSTTETNSMGSVKSALQSHHPVILNGIGNGPYTQSGHYVMATGMTKDGKIKVSDPLNKRSGAYDPRALSMGTRKAWISNKPMGGSGFDFGGMGSGDAEKVINSARKLIGKSLLIKNLFNCWKVFDR